jgi:hypothetical protein
VKDYNFNQKRAARACEVGARAVHAALGTAEKGRQVGMPGRPRVFTEKQEREFVDVVRKGVEAKNPMNFFQAQEKVTFFSHL